MVTITLKDKKYYMPANWGDINIYKLQQLYKIYDKNIDDEIEKNILILNLLTDIPKNDIYDLPIQEYNKLLNSISFINRDFEDKDYSTFIIDNKKYELDVNIENISTKKFIDLDELQKGGYKNLHILMAMLYKPKNEKDYDVDIISKRAELFLNNMPASYCLSTVTFFLQISGNIVNNSEVFSVVVIKMLTEEMKEKMEQVKMITN